MGRDVGGLERDGVTFDLRHHRIVEANGRLDPVPQLLLAVREVGRRHDCPSVHRDIALRRNLHLVDGLTERRAEGDAVLVAGTLAIGAEMSGRRDANHSLSCSLMRSHGGLPSTASNPPFQPVSGFSASAAFWDGRNTSGNAKCQWKK